MEPPPRPSARRSQTSAPARTGTGPETWPTLLTTIPGTLRRDFPDLGVSSPNFFHDVATYQVTSDDITVRLQTIKHRAELLRLDTAPTPVRLVYPDLPPTALLRVPSRDAFVALKLSAYADRKAPRDLFDLAQLTSEGAFTEAAMEAFRQLTGSRPAPAILPSPPTPVEWAADLGSPSSAYDAVASALNSPSEG